LRALRQVWTIAAKDLAIELRTKESLNAAAAFSIVILVLFSFVFDPFSDTTREIGGGLLWLVFVFAGALVFNRGFARELPNECLDALMSSPLQAGNLVIGKALANFVMLLVVEVISLVVFGIFYNVTWTHHLPLLVAVLALGTWGISVLGSVFGALTVNLRLRELMLPVIIYPMLVPLLIGASELTGVLLLPQAVESGDLIWFRVMGVFDVVVTALALLLADTILVN
jgi:heme exporter protein B